MRVRMMVWHVTLATAGAWLLYRMAEPLRVGDLSYVNWFIWSVWAVLRS